MANDFITSIDDEVLGRKAVKAFIEKMRKSVGSIQCCATQKETMKRLKEDIPKSPVPSMLQSLLKQGIRKVAGAPNEKVALQVLDQLEEECDMTLISVASRFNHLSAEVIAKANSQDI